MERIFDFQILQRDKTGVCRCTFAGNLSEPLKDTECVIARAVQEDDGLVVQKWTIATLTEDGGWEVPMVLPQGGLYRLEARRTDNYIPNYSPVEWHSTIRLVEHVGVGDVFVTAGQSNMSGFGRDSAYDPPTLGVHVFANDGRWKIASHPINCVVNPIYPNNELCGGISPALSFARNLSRGLRLPVGLIQAAMGASFLHQWNPEEKGDLYQLMVRKIHDSGSGLAGMIWYQGCGDCNHQLCVTYLDRFKTMVRHFREEFGDLPIVTCQLNRTTGGDFGAGFLWGKIKESQRQAALQIHDCYLVPTLDCYITDDIHNGAGSNVIIGERMAKVLLRSYYGLPGLQTPVLRRVVRVDDTHIRLLFDADLDMRCMGHTTAGLNVQDETGLMNCVYAEEQPDLSICVTTERPMGAEAFFHAYWRQDPESTYCIRSMHGLPMPSCFMVPVENA